MRQRQAPAPAPRALRTLAGVIDTMPDLATVAFAVLRARREQKLRRGESPEAREDWSQITNERKRPSKRVTTTLTVAMELLRACGLSPGQRLLGLTVCDAETGASIGLRDAAKRTLVLRSTSVLPSLAMWLVRRNEAQRGDAAATLHAQIRDAYEQHKSDPAGTKSALQRIYRENPGMSAPSRALFAGLSAGVGTGILKRLLRARLRKTVVVRRSL